MWNLVDEIVLFLDQDKAGQNSTYKTALLALSMINANKKLSIINIPFPGDPDDFIKMNDASDQNYMHNAIRSRDSLSTYLFNKALLDGDFSSPEGIAKTETTLFDHCKLIKDLTLRKHFKSFLKYHLNKTLYSLKKNSSVRIASNLKIDNSIITGRNGYHTNSLVTQIEREILIILLTCPRIQEDDSISNLLLSISFTNSNVVTVIDYILECEWRGDLALDDKRVLSCLRNLKLAGVLDCNIKMDNDGNGREYKDRLKILRDRHGVEVLKQEYAAAAANNAEVNVLQSYLKEIRDLEKSINEKLISS